MRSLSCIENHRGEEGKTAQLVGLEKPTKKSWQRTDELGLSQGDEQGKYTRQSSDRRLVDLASSREDGCGRRRGRSGTDRRDGAGGLCRGRVWWRCGQVRYRGLWWGRRVSRGYDHHRARLGGVTVSGSEGDGCRVRGTARVIRAIGGRARRRGNDRLVSRDVGRRGRGGGRLVIRDRGSGHGGIRDRGRERDRRGIGGRCRRVRSVSDGAGGGFQNRRDGRQVRRRSRHRHGVRRGDRVVCRRAGVDHRGGAVGRRVRGARSGHDRCHRAGGDVGGRHDLRGGIGFSRGHDSNGLKDMWSAPCNRESTLGHRLTCSEEVDVTVGVMTTMVG